MLAPEFVKHRQDFLRLAEGEERDEHAGAAVEGALDGLRETQFLAGAREAFRRGAVAAGRLDDEHVELFLGKAARLA